MTFDEMIHRAQAFEDARQDNEEIDDEEVTALCDAIRSFDVQTVEHIHGLILLTGLSASPDLRRRGAYALRGMNPALVAGEFNTMVRGNEEQRELALGALGKMRLKVTSSVGVAMNEAGGVVDFLLDFLASDAPGLNRSSAASLLGSIGADLERVVPVLKAAAASDDDWVTQDAEWALEKIADR